MRRSAHKFVDYGIMSAVFIIVAIHLWGWIMSTVDTFETDYSSGFDYALYWYPMEENMIEVVFSLFLLFKAIRFNVCLYTKIVTWMYLGMSALSLSHIIFMFDYEVYYMGLSLIFIFGIMTVTMLFVMNKGYRALRCWHNQRKGLGVYKKV